MNVASTLRKIAAELEAMEAQVEQGHEIDAYHLIITATRLKAQAEMIEKGLVG